MKKAIKKAGLYSEIRELIASARQRVAVAVNAELSLLYWQVGKRINDEVLDHKRADYGRQVIEELSGQLVDEFGVGWGYRHLMFCAQFASCFADIEIVNTLCSQLSWSHIKILLGQDDPLKREFYAEMCRAPRVRPSCISFRDLLMQRYTTIGGAYAQLGFRGNDDAMNFYRAIQRELYAA